jgi:hypothetical protein
MTNKNTIGSFTTLGPVSFLSDTQTLLGSVTNLGAWTLGTASGAQHTAYTNNSTSFKFQAPAANGVNVEYIADNTVPTRVIFNTANYSWRTGTLSSNTEIGLVSSTGAWTLGTSGGSQNHTINGQLVFNEQSGFNSGAMLWRDTSDRIRMNFNGGLLLANDADSTTFATCGSGGAWTLGPSTGTNNTTMGTMTIDAPSAFANANDPICLLVKRTTGGNNRLLVGYNGATRGYIRINSGETNLEFEATSDRRVKTDITPLDGSLEKLTALNPVSFKMKHNLNVECEGFIAQEFNDVFPKAVSKTDNGEGEELPEGTSPWTMGDAILIPHLVKAIQELKAKNDELEARLSVLESN